MSQQATIKRYLLLIEKVKRATYPSKQNLIDLLNAQGLSCSERTFQRSLESIRNEFGVEIAYHSDRRGYYINDELSVDYEPFLRFLDIAQSANTLIETLRDGKESLQYIHFDSSSHMIGVHYLQPLLRAVKENLKVELSYSHFQKEGNRSFIMHPELLKEYMNRWYVMGHVDYAEEARVYALDRITKLEVLPDTFTRKLGSAEDVFGGIIGVDFSGEKIEKVVLSFTPSQGDYIRTLPLHTLRNHINNNKLGDLRVSLENQKKHLKKFKEKSEIHITDMIAISALEKGILFRENIIKAKKKYNRVCTWEYYLKHPEAIEVFFDL